MLKGTDCNFHRNGTKFEKLCVSKMSSETFFMIFEISILTPFSTKKAFLRPKMVKIQDFFTDMPCYLSNQTIQPAHYFFELFSSKHAK